MGITSGGSPFSLKEFPGYQQGFVPKYNATTSFKITAGSYEADGDLFSLAADHIHTMTSLAAGFDHHYTYLDKSASSPAVPVFYDETTEAVENIVKNGWYHPVNTEDRLVISLYSPGDGTSTLKPFNAVVEGKSILIMSGLEIFPRMANLQNPTGSVETPNMNDGSVVTPVNADKILINMNSRRAGNIAQIGASTAEYGAVGAAERLVVNSQFYYLDGETAYGNFWLNLGASNNILIGGGFSDDNFLACLFAGNRQRR